MPRPSDFDLFWKDRMAEADAVGLDYAIEAASVTDAVTCQLFDLWYTGMCGARLHAKYLKPVSDEPVPWVRQFHGYPGASRSWFEQASFAGMGMALIALDCPGQGGPSEDLVHGGHLNRAIISATAEIQIQVIDGEIGREFSEDIGLNLFKF